MKLTNPKSSTAVKGFAHQHYIKTKKNIDKHTVVTRQKPGNRVAMRASKIPGTTPGPCLPTSRLGPGTGLQRSLTSFAWVKRGKAQRRRQRSVRNSLLRCNARGCTVELDLRPGTWSLESLGLTFCWKSGRCGKLALEKHLACGQQTPQIPRTKESSNRTDISRVELALHVWILWGAFLNTPAPILQPFKPGTQFVQSPVDWPHASP